MAVRLEAIASDPTYVLWIGDGAKNDQNAIMYVKTNGSGYFGGSLTAGSLVAEGINSNVNFNGAETGVFNTNGAGKTVTFSVSYSNNGYITNGSLAGPTGATLILERSLNGGGWVHVATAYGSGSVNQTYDGEFNRYWTNVHCNGSGTFIDNTGGQPTFNYRIRVIDPIRWPYVLTGPSGQQPRNGQQDTRVRSVEG